MSMAYDEMQHRRKAIINGEDRNDSYDIIYHGREFNHQHPRAFYLQNDIYPISNVTFEGYAFSAPANVHSYLKKNYGGNYMSLPKGGILHHDEGRGPLSTWARKNHIDMNQIMTYLNDYSKQILM